MSSDAIINRDCRFKKNASVCFFLFAFPLNFLYNLAYVKGWVPEIPGLGYPVIMHLCIPFIVILSLHYINKLFFKKYYTLFMLYIFLGILLSFFGYLTTYYFYGTAPLFQGMWALVYTYAYAFMMLFLLETDAFGEKGISFFVSIIYCIGIY